MLSKNFIQVKIPEKTLSENKILESLSEAQKVDKIKIIDTLKKSIDILDSQIKQQAIKYVTQRDSKKNTKGGLNKRKKSLKKFYKD